MAEQVYDVTAAERGDAANRILNVEIDAANLDSPTGLAETSYMNDKWPLQLGIYKNIPEFKIAVDMRAIWTVGNEIEAAPEIRVIMDHVRGWGKDTFRNIIKNMIVVKRLGQDSYAEIIRDESGEIFNLKPLDPSTIKQVYDKKGNLIRYEQVNRQSKSTAQKFSPRDILHFTNKRVADEVHGVADSDALKKIIEANNESFADVRLLMHRWVKPIMKFMLATDNPREIKVFAKLMDEIINIGDNLYLPKDTAEHEVIAVSGNSTLNPMPWREHLKNYFFQVVGIPQIILGSSGEFTESTAKIAYLAFEQSVKDEQADIMEQISDQLGLEIKLKFPASLRNELLTDEAKDGEEGKQVNIQPNETTAGSGR